MVHNCEYCGKGFKSLTECEAHEAIHRQEEKKENATSIPVMLTVQATADAFNLTYSGVRALIRDRRINYIKVGNKFLVNKQSVIDYLVKGE